MDSNFFAGPSYMTGGYLPIYAGGRRHRGGGLLGSMRSGFAPVKRSFISGASGIRKRFVPIKAAGSVIKRRITRKRLVPIKRSITRKAAPIKKSIASTATNIGKRVVSGTRTFGKHLASGVKSLAGSRTLQRMGRKALVKGAELGAQVAVDALTGRHVGDSITERSKETALEALTGERAKSIKRPSVHLQRKLKQRKRLAPFRSHRSLPPGKRLRKARSRARLNRRQLF